MSTITAGEPTRAASQRPGGEGAGARDGRGRAAHDGRSPCGGRAADLRPDELTRTAEFKAAERARDELDAAEQRLDDISEAELGLLRMTGGGARGAADRNGPRSGEGGGNWRTVAQGIDLARGVDRVEVPLSRLLGARTPMAAGGLTVTGDLSVPALLQPVAGLPLDTRGLFAYLQGEQLDPTDAAISDFKVTSREGRRRRDRTLPGRHGRQGRTENRTVAGARRADAVRRRPAGRAVQAVRLRRIARGSAPG